MTRATAILALGLALAGCETATPIRYRPRPAPVLVEPGPVLAIGDSLLTGARDEGELEVLLADAGWELEIVAEGGRQVSWATDVIEARATVPDTVVVVLGSNPSPTLGTFPEDAAELVDALRARGARRILWVPPHHREPERYAERAAALRALEGRLVEVLAWPAVIDPHPDWYQGDGLHLTADGYAALARFLRDELSTA